MLIFRQNSKFKSGDLSPCGPSDSATDWCGGNSYSTSWLPL